MDFVGRYQQPKKLLLLLRHRCLWSKSSQPEKSFPDLRIPTGKLILSRSKSTCVVLSGSSNSVATILSYLYRGFPSTCFLEQKLQSVLVVSHLLRLYSVSGLLNFGFEIGRGIRNLFPLNSNFWTSHLSSSSFQTARFSIDLAVWLGMKFSIISSFNLLFRVRKRIVSNISLLSVCNS